MTPPWGERRRGAPSPSGSAAISAGHGQCVSRCGETHSAPLRCSPGCRRTWTARTSASRPRTTARCCWRSSLLWRIGASKSNRIAIRMLGREGPAFPRLVVAGVIGSLIRMLGREGPAFPRLVGRRSNRIAIRMLGREGRRSRVWWVAGVIGSRSECSGARARRSRVWWVAGVIGSRSECSGARARRSRVWWSQE